VLNWFNRMKARTELPEYSAVRAVPTRGLPPDLEAKEASEAFSVQRQAFERSLELGQCPRVDSPLFVELLTLNDKGLLTMTLPEERQCLLVFSSPSRAGDYINTLLKSGPPVKYLCSSPVEFVMMLSDLRGMGIEQFAFDRCPRCDVFTAIKSASVTTADDAVACWSIWKATELARLDLYLGHASILAGTGRLDAARDVALETVAHVSLDDPRAHLLLGQIAVALRDRKLLGEARTFLQFLKRESWERRLDQDIQSGSPDFEYVNWTAVAEGSCPAN
jgi:hypothetical protein